MNQSQACQELATLKLYIVADMFWNSEELWLTGEMCKEMACIFQGRVFKQLRQRPHSHKHGVQKYLTLQSIFGALTITLARDPKQCGA